MTEEQILKQILKLRQEDKHQQTINFIENLNDEQKTYEVKSELGLAYTKLAVYISDNNERYEIIQKALKIFESIKTKGQKDCKFYYRLGFAYYEISDYKNALKFLEKSLAINKNYGYAKVLYNSVKKGMPKHIVITEETIKNIDEDNYYEILDPLCRLYNLGGFDDYQKYNESLKQFTKQQKIIFALDEYIRQVYYGGHEQFFDNFTGMLWQDVFEGLKSIGHKEALENFEKVLALFGEEPSFDMEKRRDQLQKFDDEVDKKSDELDKNFYEYEDILTYIVNSIKNNSKEFLFDGVI